MNKRNKKTIVFIIFAALLVCTTVVVATVLFKSSVKTQGSATANEVDKVVDVDDTTKDNLVVDTSIQTLNFNKAGDSQSLTITVKNNTKAVISYQYEFSFDSDTILKTESFASAILVYFNGNFIDTLGNLCSNDENKVKSGYINFQGFVNAAQTSDSKTYTSSTQTDEIKFVLHSAADGSIFDNDASNLSFKLKTFAKTADYSDYIYVTNESDFVKAIDDINSGILSANVTIVLFNNISLKEVLTINYPFELDLNGYYLNNTKKINLKQSGKVVIKSLRKLSVSSIEDNLNENFNIILNNENGILEIKDLYNQNGTNLASDYADIVTTTSYSSNLAKELISAYIKDKVKYGILSTDALNILNGLACYSEKSGIQTSSNITFKSGNNTISLNNNVKGDFTNTSEEYITFNGETIGVKVFGTDETSTLNSLFAENGELYYLTTLALTDETGNIITTNSADLFLPTSIKNKNITIEWKSNNSEYISDKGIIQNDVNNGTKVSLTGYFTINNKVLTKTINIKISSQNHDTIFQYFIAQLSPITIEHVYSSGRELYSYYYLPIVASSTSNKYHYTNAYTTPYNEDSSSTEVGYSWLGFNDVAFESLTYSQIPAYNFISIDQNAVDTNHNNDKGVAVYLGSATFETFAQINLVGKFANDDEEYSGKVNIIINPGYDTSLNELVFEKTEQDLAQVDVLQNILDTRKVNNMLNEKGDFILDGRYNTYYIQYVIPSSSVNAISQIIGYSDEACTQEVANISGEYIYSESSDSNWRNMFTIDQMKQIIKYKICLNPEGFDLNESSFGVNVVLVMPTSDNVLHTAARIQYFTCPGVIKCDSQGFSNMSVFNSAKYQVWNELKSLNNESYNSDVRNDDYTLSTDSSSFTISNNIVTNHTGAYILRHDANLCTSLVFDATETVTNTDNHIVYGLAKLIDWATGDTTHTISTHFNDNTYLSDEFKTTYGDYKSDGNSYLTTNEEYVIKAYYQTYINSTLTDDQWSTLINSVSYNIKDSNNNSKYIITSYSELQKAVLSYWENTKDYGVNYDWGSSGKTASYIFGKWNDGIICWAYNTRDIGDRAGSRACYGTYDWTGLISNDYSEWSSSSNSSYDTTKYYTSSEYVTDNTSYITVYELEVLMAFLLNTKSGKSSSSSSTNSAAKQEVQRIRDTYFVIPRYFNTDGIGTLISQAYIDLNKSLTGTSESGFTAELNSFEVAGSKYITPHVTLMDNSTNGLDYFPNLETLYIHGDTDTKKDHGGSLSAFHLDSTLTQVFNKLINSNTKLKNLGLEYCSSSNMSLEIDNIYKLSQLERISLQDNQAISNIGALLKLNLSNLKYVNVANINLLNQYSTFTLSAINLKAQANGVKVYYSKDGNSNSEQYTTKLAQDAEGLIYLEEFYTLLAENAQLAQNVYDADGNSVSVQWGIESGNGITYIDSSNTSSFDSIDYPYTNYYFVTSDFTYLNITFTANHLYRIYSNDSGTSVAFEEVKDSEGNAITLLDGEPDDTLTEEEKNAALSGLEKQNIEEKGEYSLTQTGSFNSVDISTNSSNKPSNSEASIYASSSRTTVTCYNSSDDVVATYSGCYSFGYLSTTLSRTLTYTKDNYTLTNGVGTSVTKYYYVSESGYYNIYKKVYDVTVADSMTQTTYTREDRETFKCWYVSNNRSGWWNYTYSFTNLLAANSNIRYIECNNKTYYVNDLSYGYSLTSGEETSTLSTENDVNYIDVSSNSVLYSAMNANTSLSNAILSINKVYMVNNAVAYNEGVTTLASTLYNITLGENGFVYSSTSSTTAMQNAKYMDELLSTANTHLNDAMFGLYYHKYYAYGGGTASYNEFDYTQYGVYYLDINSSGRFYWELVYDGEGNQVLYETKTGDYTAIDELVASITSKDLNKVYYYTGSSNDTFRQGTGVWYHVIYDETKKSYELARFGIISDSYLYYDTSGKQNIRVVSANSNKLQTICNLVEYMDTSTFTTGVTTTPFDRLIGGTYDAVIKAIITVNGKKYERLFVISVAG